MSAAELRGLMNGEPPAGSAIEALAAEQRAGSSWTPVDLRAVLEGDHADPEPDLLARVDGRALLYPGRVHALSGEPEACKGWIALAAAAEQINAGHKVLYVDFEDTPGSVTARLAALGVGQEAIVDRFVYIGPDEPLDDASRETIDHVAEDVTLAVLDGVTEALALHGLDLASNIDVAAWLALLPRPLSRAGVAVLTIDHVVKDREQRGRYAIGAQHKLAGVDVAYNVAVITPFGRGRDGRVKVTVAKDRPGHVRGFAAEDQRVAEAVLTSGDDGSVAVRLEAPAGQAGTFRPTTLMGRVSKLVEAEPGLSLKAVRTAVAGKARAVDLALELLVAEGHVEMRKDGQAHRHFSKRPYRPETDDRVPVSRPCPDRVPDTVSGTVSPCPPPYRDTDTGHGSPDTPDADRVPGHGDDPDVARAEQFEADHADLSGGDS